MWFWSHFVVLLKSDLESAHTFLSSQTKLISPRRSMVLSHPSLLDSVPCTTLKLKSYLHGKEKSIIIGKTIAALAQKTYLPWLLGQRITIPFQLEFPDFFSKNKVKIGLAGMGPVLSFVRARNPYWRESQYSWPPCTNKLRSATLDNGNCIYFLHKTRYLQWGGQLH
jgi:hypothetical protein